MEFLVNVEIEWPPDGDPKRLWRVPGRWANWGL
jgi:muconolactone delta-isomerase